MVSKQTMKKLVSGLDEGWATKQYGSKSKAKSFDEYHFDKEPKLGSLIIQIIRFATLQIVNIDPKKAVPNDIAITIVHTWLFSKTIVTWI